MILSVRLNAKHKRQGAAKEEAMKKKNHKGGYLSALICMLYFWFNSYAIADTEIIVPTVNLAYSFRIVNHEGKKVIIDFAGDKIKISGDLPIEEAAKIFFENVHGLCKCQNTNE